MKALLTASTSSAFVPIRRSFCAFSEFINVIL